MKVSIVVLNFNGAKFLPTCLNSVLETDYSSLEVICVDNGSTDESLDILQHVMSKDDRVKVIANPKNRGWSAGNNVGIRASTGDIIILLSNDTEVTHDWLANLVDVIERDPTIGVAQPKILSIFDKKSLDSAGGFLDSLGYAYAYVPEGPVDEVFHTEGVVMCIRRTLFDKIGLFDEDFFMEFDDHDFCWRARLLGYKVVVVTDSVVFHVRGGVTGPTLMTRRLSNIRRYTQNHLFSMIKNYELSNIVRFVPLASVLEVGKATWFGAKGNWLMTKATLEGILGIPFNLRRTWRKRLLIQSMRKIRDETIFKSMVRFNPNALKLFYRYQTAGKRPFLSPTTHIVKCE